MVQWIGDLGTDVAYVNFVSGIYVTKKNHCFIHVKMRVTKYWTIHITKTHENGHRR